MPAEGSFVAITYAFGLELRALTDFWILEAFGSFVLLSGLYLAVTSKAGSGRSTLSLWGAEITLVAAGGILVMFLGILTFALPFDLSWKADQDAAGRTTIDQLRIAYRYAPRSREVAAGECGNRIGEAASSRGLKLLPSGFEQEFTYKTGDAKVWIMCLSDTFFAGAVSYDQPTADHAMATALDIVTDAGRKRGPR